jgi:hypothetical protein
MISMAPFRPAMLNCYFRRHHTPEDTEGQIRCD